MSSRIIFILVLSTYSSAFNSGTLRQYGTLSRPECQANKIYQKDDVTCFCNKYGRWPHKNCSLVFDEQVECKPNSIVEIDCNVCRCSATGFIEKEFCTNYICTEETNDRILFRRSNTHTKCTINNWYAISMCRLCFCITKDNLLCSAQTNSKEMQVGRYNLTECGPDWLNDLNRLLSSVNPLRIGDERGKTIKKAKRSDSKILELGSQVLFKDKVSKDIQDNEQALNTNQENVGNKEVKIARNDDRSINDQDSFSESNSDEKVENKAILPNGGNTVMPFENDEEINNSLESDKRESDDESGDNKKQSAEENESREIDTVKNNKENTPSVEENSIEESSGSFLKLNLPGILSKVFNLEARKSMVSINESNCEPGSTLTVECNACFCLTNGKLLCTEKICK